VFVQPLLQWKSNKYYIFWVCACSLSYPARIAHAPYQVLGYILVCGLSDSTYKWYLFGGKHLFNIKCVFWFTLQILAEIFVILPITQRHIIIHVLGLHVKYPLFLSDFNQMLHFSTDFLKILNPLNAELNPICNLLILLGDLTFMGTCIVSIFQYISNKMQRYTVYSYLETALRV
jgi:hypothetical protein